MPDSSLPAAAERFRRNYLVAFLRYLSRHDEATLSAAYDLGRSAMEQELSLLDVVQVHHRVLLDAARDSVDDDETERITASAATFLVETLATYEMGRRAFIEANRSGGRRHRPT